jgi:hypothetical protein
MGEGWSLRMSFAMTELILSTSRNEGRQKEQLAALGKVKLSKEEIEEIAEAGKGRFLRYFMKPVWDAAKP